MDEPTSLPAPVVATRPDPLHYLGAMISGLGLGLLVYRFAVLGLAWNHSRSWLFPGLAVGAAMIGQQIARSRPGPRPPLIGRILVGLAGAALAFGAVRFVVPPLADTRLTVRALPGFSVALPAADQVTEQLDYMTGKVELRNVASMNSGLIVGWSADGGGEESVDVAAKALATTLGAGTTYALIEMAGPQATKVPTILLHTPKGEMRMSLLPCGKRTITVTSIGTDGSAAVHARVLTSIVCTPDAALEVRPDGALRLAIDLPGWQAHEKLPSQVTLFDPTGTVGVLLSEQQNTTVPLVKMANALLPTLFDGVKVGAADQGFIAFSATSDGAPLTGWIADRTCPTHRVFIVMFADASGDDTALRAAVRGAHCLGPKDPLTSWPDAPK